MAATDLKTLIPGIALAAGAVAVAQVIHNRFDSLSPLVAAVALGVLYTNLVGLTPRLAPGTTFAAKHLMRVGVALLGLQLSFDELAELGGRGLLVVAVTVAATFFGTRWAGRRLGVSDELALLVATGYAICGASAIAAMKSVSRADDDEVAYSLALVTLCGSLAVLVLPGLGHLLGLHDAAYGNWIGAAVHDVGQVVAAATPDGTGAIHAAVVVKLTRVVLLAPLVAGVSLGRRQAIPMAADAHPSTTSHPPLLPLFVGGFLAAIALRSTNVLPVQWLSVAKQVQTMLLSAALFGLGCGVKIDQLRKVGGRPLALGLISWVVVTAVAFGATKALPVAR